MIHTIIRLPEPDDWNEAIPHHIVCAYISNQGKVAAMLQWFNRNSGKFDARLSSYECLREFGIFMPRGKKTNGTANDNGSNNRSSAGGGAQWKWGNCKLSNEDIATLERDQSTVEYLATCLVALGSDGFGFTCKPVDKGESYCCTIFRPDYPSVGTTVGVSAFAGNIRDAILTCLYKLDNYGGGDFTGFDIENDNQGSKPRFR